MIHQNRGRMESTESKKFLPPDDSSRQQETPASIISLNKITTWLSDGRFVTYIIFLYRAIILILLIYIAAKPNDQPAFSLASTPQCSPLCPRPWIGYGGKCYYFSSEKRDWISSHHNCSSYSASLARLEEEDMDFVRQHQNKGIYWIGLWRVLSKNWKWSDGENAITEVIGGGGGGDCAYLDNTGRAVASGCHTKLPWICSKPATCTTRSVTDT